MGIPSFYKWLAERFPKTVVKAVEETPATVNGVPVAIDTSQPNPNGMEFDNLYLDMNGIIHPCFHPEGLPSPSRYEEVFAAVFKYIDRIFSIVRPRKLLFLAIDGVAPRAKMNQQRSRRFKSAKEAAETLGSLKQGRSELSKQPNTMDSNVITPGTEFMDLLSSALRYYVHLRMNEDLGWRGLKVILSDASVPGEGEHKIMSYIRLQRNLSGYDPNTSHCLYGLDADLIMLALATHEIHFSVLREGAYGSDKNSRILNKRKRNNFNVKMNSKQTGKVAKHLEDYILGLKFQFLNIWVLREYLSYDMRISDSTFEVDMERLIDDFVFMCLFVGNDFLPQIPSLEITKGAIDLLMMVYKKEFVRMGGYLTNSFEIHLTRVEHFIQVVGSHEHAIYRKWGQIQKQENHFQQISKKKYSKFHHGDRNRRHGSVFSRKQETSILCQDLQNIKAGEEGWKERFYAEKFEAKSEEEREKIRRNAVFKYTEGICWVMRYYYEGVCSWQWFYPHHYAPFASDFYGLDQFEIQFTLGKPFKPFDQLMGVLPAASAHTLPLFYRQLMTDSSSPILDFYPSEFELDMNGKRFPWQAICKLPFIEESRLLLEIAKVEHTLTDEERRRNSLGLDILFVHVSHPLAIMVIHFSKQYGHPESQEVNDDKKIDPKISDGMNGYIYISDKPVWPSEIYSPIDAFQLISNNQVISVFYKYPPFHSHIPRLPEGVILPNKSVRNQDFVPLQQLWHETAGFGGVLSRRPIHKSVSGLRLAKLARRLVCAHTKCQQAFVKPSFYAEANRLRETEINSKKRKRGGNDKNIGSNRTQGRKEGHAVPKNNLKNLDAKLESCGNVKNLGDCILGEQKGDGNVHVTADEKMGIIKEVKSKKRKRKSKKKKSTNCILVDEREDANVVGASGIAEIKAQVTSELKNYTTDKQRVDGSYMMSNVSNETRSIIVDNTFQKLDSVVHGDKRESNNDPEGMSEPELKPELISKRKKRRPKKKAKLDVATENMESGELRKQGEYNADHVCVNGLRLTGTEIKPHDFPKLGSSGVETKKMEFNVLRKAGESNDDLVGVDGLGLTSGSELKTEVQSKKKKSKKAKGDALHVQSNSSQKLESVPMKQGEDNAGVVGVQGLGLTETDIKSNDFPNLENSGLQPEVMSKRKKRKSKKAKLAEVNVVLTKSSEKLAAGERLESVPVKQGENNADVVGVQGLGLTETNIKSNDFPKLAEVNLVLTQSSEKLAAGEKLESVPVKQGENNAEDVGVKGLGLTDTDIKSNDIPKSENPGLELKVMPKRKRRKSKKVKLAEVDVVLTKSSEELVAGEILESVRVKQGESNADVLGVQGLGLTKTDIKSNDFPTFADVNVVLTKSIEKLAAGEKLQSVPVKQGENNADIVGVQGLGLTETEIKSNDIPKSENPELEPKVMPKRKRRKSKKAKLAEVDVVLTKSSEKLVAGEKLESVPVKQGENNADVLGVQGLRLTETDIKSNDFPKLAEINVVPTKSIEKLAAGEKLESVPVKQGENNADVVGVQGLGLTETDIESNDIPKSENPGLEPKVMPKRKRRKSKKAKLAEVDVVLTKSSEKVESVPVKQGENNAAIVGVQGLGLTETDTKSNDLPKLAEVDVVLTWSSEKLTAGEKLESVPVNQGENNADVVGVQGLELTETEIKSNDIPKSENPGLEPEVMPKRKRRKSRKAKLAEVDNVPTNSSEKLAAGVSGAQGECSSDHLRQQSLGTNAETLSNDLQKLDNAGLTANEQDIKPGFSSDQTSNCREILESGVLRNLGECINDQATDSCRKQESGLLRNQGEHSTEQTTNGGEKLESGILRNPGERICNDQTANSSKKLDLVFSETTVLNHNT